MPNHVHGIVIFNKPDEDVKIRHCLISSINEETLGKKRFQNQGKNTLSSIIGSYKSVLTKNARKINSEFAWYPLLYEHIIRNKKSYENIQNYIVNNPKN